MLRGRGAFGLTSSMHGASARVGGLQPTFGAPLAAGSAMEELRKEAGLIRCSSRSDAEIWSLWLIDLCLVEMRITAPCCN
jgi:hypothetical protein